MLCNIELPDELDFWRELSVVAGMESPLTLADTTPNSAETSLASKVGKIAALNLEALRIQWRSEFRRDPPKGLSRDLLIRTLAWRLQEKAFGGHDKATAKLLESYARGNGDSPLHRRLKAGTVLVREYQNTRHTVTIIPDGYLWQDKVYPNLTVIARAITGTNWNGPRFFGLREGAKKSAKSVQVRP